MIKRSLRAGIRLGILAGIVFAVLKLVQGKRPPPPLHRQTDEWTSVLPESPRATQPDLIEPAMLTSVGRQDLAEEEAPSALTVVPEAARAPVIDPGPTVAPPPEPPPDPTPAAAAPVDEAVATRASSAPPAKKGTIKKVSPAKKAGAGAKAGTARPVKKAAAKKAAGTTKKATAKKAGAPRKRTPPPS
ncbi:MAG: hypothetical protein M3O23_12700 [Actinomycetota bacterium]|nr:hypothetical protein [Actinomycetota bacterium]